MASKQPLYKRVLTDVGGVLCLLAVPFLGPIPGPGGIPLIIAGLGLLAVNHDWADNMLQYVKKHSQSLRGIIFPNKIYIERIWDIVAVLIMSGGIILSFTNNHWVLQGISIGFVATSTTILVLNRNRISKVEKLLKRYGKK